MAERTEGWDKPSPDSPEELPYVITPDGEKRFLAALPTPSDHIMRALPTYEGAGFDMIPRSAWPTHQFSRRWTVVPILDQNGRGACLPHSWARRCMLARVRSGAPFVKFSPWFLYTLINGGVDAGSNAGDALQALKTTGICHWESVPYLTIRPRGYSQAAMSEAAQNKLGDAVRITSFEEAVSAAYFGWDICFDVYAGSFFNTDSRGIVPRRRGPNNHEVGAGEEFKLLPDGTPLIGGDNSWGTQWGMNGFCYYLEDTINDSQETYAVRWMAQDPTDSEMPPAAP